MADAEAVSGAFEGILQKQGGGTSLLGSKGWTTRFVRVVEGQISWWKTSKDAEVGRPPRKNLSVPLSKYAAVMQPAAKDDGAAAEGPAAEEYTNFSLIALDKSALEDRKLRSEYHFRAEKKADAEAWLKVMHEHGSSETAPVPPEESAPAEGAAAEKAEEAEEAEEAAEATESSA